MSSDAPADASRAPNECLRSWMRTRRGYQVISQVIRVIRDRSSYQSSLSGTGLHLSVVLVGCRGQVFILRRVVIGVIGDRTSSVVGRALSSALSGTGLHISYQSSVVGDRSSFFDRLLSELSGTGLHRLSDARCRGHGCRGLSRGQGFIFDRLWVVTGPALHS
jgi:hypothetical protein